MQMLLPPEHFKYAVSLQPIDRNLPNTGTLNKDITSAIDSAEPQAEFSTLLDKVKDAN